MARHTKEDIQCARACYLVIYLRVYITRTLYMSHTAIDGAIVKNINITYSGPTIVGLIGGSPADYRSDWFYSWLFSEAIHWTLERLNNINNLWLIKHHVWELSHPESEIITTFYFVLVFPVIQMFINYRREDFI